MSTYILPVIVNGAGKKVEVMDLPDKSGFSGYYYNYRFVIKKLKNKTWKAVIYRPGTAAVHKMIVDENPHMYLGTLTLEYIVTDYKSILKSS